MAAAVGSAASVRVPAGVKRALLTTNDAFSRGARQSPVMMRAPSNTVTVGAGVWAGAAADHTAAMIATNGTNNESLRMRNTSLRRGTVSDVDGRADRRYRRDAAAGIPAFSSVSQLRMVLAFDMSCPLAGMAIPTAVADVVYGFLAGLPGGPPIAMPSTIGGRRNLRHARSSMGPTNAPIFSIVVNIIVGAGEGP